jgi:long-chain fatty acid transport protein
MNRNHTLLALALASYTGTSFAGGIQLYEAGQEGAGLANAGAAVLATDPSVLMNNPAGISALSGTQVALTGQMIFGGIRFSRDSDNDFSGSEGGNPLPVLPGSSFFISHQLDDRSSIGFGMYGTFGLSLDYDDDWAGRYFSQESTILGISLQPTYAYKINDDLSIGIGPRLVYGYYRTEIALNQNLLPGDNYQDGQVRFKDTDVGYGANVGVRYQLNPSTVLGATYTSKVDLEFKDSPEFKRIDNPLLSFALRQVSIDGLELDMTIPQTFTVSVSHQLDPQWTLLASANWQDWSEFGEIGADIDTARSDISRTADRQYKDTYHFSVGAQNQLSKDLRWNMGVGYDSSAVDDKDRTVDNPMGETWRLATGLNYKVDEELSLNLNYALVWMGDMEVQQTKANGNSVSGEYRNSALHIIGGGATWRF